MRPRKHNRDLPACVYYRHGSYFHVKNGKWRNLGRDKQQALIQYTVIISEPRNSVSGLLDRFIADSTDRVKKGELKPNTLKQYEANAKAIRKTFIEFSADQVQSTHIEQFMDHHRKTPNMANRMHTVLMGCFKHALKMGYCQINPVIGVGKFIEKKRDRYLSDEEYAAIREAGSQTLRMIMDVAYLTGQRIGDVLKIKLGDISADGIYFKQQKTGKRILVRMTPELQDVVNGAKRQHRHITVYLLGQRNGKIRSYRGVRDVFARACKKAMVSDAHLHDIRAKSITDAKAQGLDPQLLAGHSTEAMTLRYIRNKQTDVADGPSIGHVLNLNRTHRRKGNTSG